MVDDTENRTAVLQERYQGAESRLAGNEGLGTVDRIHHPDELGIRLFCGKLFTEEAVRWLRRGDHFAQCEFNPAIGVSDRREIRLRLNSQARIAKVPASLRAAGISQALGEADKVNRTGLRGHGALTVSESARAAITAAAAHWG